MAIAKLQLTAESDTRGGVVSWLFDAPRERVLDGVQILRDSDDNAYAFNGVYHAVVSPERLIFTFEFEPLAELLSIEDRAGLRDVQLDSGVAESMERLAA